MASCLVGLTPDQGVQVRFGSWQGTLCCAVFLGKTLYSHDASLHPGAKMGTRKFNTGDCPAMD